MSTGFPQQQQPQGTGAFTPTPVANPYTAETRPEWMTGWFDAPWWGTSATGGALSQQNLQYQPPQQQAPQQQAPEQQQQAPQQQYAAPDMRSQYDLFSRQRDWENRKNEYVGENTLDPIRAWAGNEWNSPMAKWERQQRWMVPLAARMSGQEQGTNPQWQSILQAWANKTQG